jgi:hypothetical protein
MNSYCTLFDSNYFSRGVALYRSLAATGEHFTLYVYCFDERVRMVLQAMALPHLVVVGLAEFESPELLRVKGERSRAEYCWTCTPHVIRHSLQTFNLDAVTYLDADIFFFSSPAVLLEELDQAGGSVLITEHRFTPGHEKALIRGKYCVQFITFKADDRGMLVLDWWSERCLEWCYARLEDGKFGDQKYLDDWTDRFAGVHVLDHPGGGVAPWNIGRYEVMEGMGGLCCREKSGGRVFELVFYHFHYVRQYADGYLDLGHFRLTGEVKRLIYTPYLGSLERAGEEIAAVDGSFDPHGISVPENGLKDRLIRFKRRLNGSYLRYADMKRV